MPKEKGSVQRGARSGKKGTAKVWKRGGKVLPPRAQVAGKRGEKKALKGSEKVKRGGIRIWTKVKRKRGEEWLGRRRMSRGGLAQSPGRWPPERPRGKRQSPKRGGGGGGGKPTRRRGEIQK